VTSYAIVQHVRTQQTISYVGIIMRSEGKYIAGGNEHKNSTLVPC
jgi:hypothetical protein